MELEGSESAARVKREVPCEVEGSPVERVVSSEPTKREGVTHHLGRDHYLVHATRRANALLLEPPLHPTSVILIHKARHLLLAKIVDE